MSDAKWSAVDISRCGAAHVIHGALGRVDRGRLDPVENRGALSKSHGVLAQSSGSPTYPQSPSARIHSTTSWISFCGKLDL